MALAINKKVKNRLEVKLMKHRILFLLIALVIGKVGMTQNFSFKYLPISVGYYGENGIHPGIKIGTSYSFYFWHGSRSTKFGKEYTRKELFLDYNLGFYSFPNNHTGYFTNVGMTFLSRGTFRKGFEFGLSFEMGYLRRSNKFETYELTSDGQISEVSFAGNNAMVLALSPIFAKEIAHYKMRIFAKPSFQFLTYTHAWQPNASLEIGLIINNYQP